MSFPITKPMITVSSMIIQATDATFDSILSNQPSLVLFYDSTNPSSTVLLQMMEQLSVICEYMHHPLSIIIIDYLTNAHTAWLYADRLPTLCLFIARIPMIYTGSFHVGDIHLWIKTHIIPSNCAKLIA